ncbi:hypothetical protein GGE07_005666 [Sinorhizobium terangae]|uniref:Nif11 family protein n=1 Tax=Sinorhizobium terangae TaxID=110322 RepID=A0A6N7L913_SINTE|nr:hypothetical protein [Sinorhizobium terangae]MBB4188987.1 hypothetical protein [Sinorhizobium terangae]MQX13435.1 hypothetical protein [Sinorhizobium terangae]
MPRTDVERFVNDIGKKGSLLESLKPSATGLASIVAIGRSLDYNITLDEVKRYVRLDRRHKPVSKDFDATARHQRGTGAAALTSLVKTTAMASSATGVPTSPVQAAGKFPGFTAVVLVVVVVVMVAT